MEEIEAKKIIADAEVKARTIIAQAEVRAFDLTQEHQKEMLEELKSHIAETIKIVVNGKIDKIDANLNTYIKEDTEWKDEYEPYIKGLANVSGGVKILVWCAVGISALIGTFLGIKSLLK